jgi:hypothetical protein
VLRGSDSTDRGVTRANDVTVLWIGRFDRHQRLGGTKGRTSSAFGYCAETHFHNHTDENLCVRWRDGTGTDSHSVSGGELAAWGSVRSDADFR